MCRHKRLHACVFHWLILVYYYLTHAVMSGCIINFDEQSQNFATEIQSDLDVMMDGFYSVLYHLELTCVVISVRLSPKPCVAIHKPHFTLRKLQITIVCTSAFTGGKVIELQCIQNVLFNTLVFPRSFYIGC